MASIWVVEQGSYSDYRVVGVFASEASATFIADTLNAAEYAYDRATVAEWPLDPAVNELRQGLRQHRVLMLRSGDVERVEPNEMDGYQLNGDVRIWRRSTAPAYIGKGIQDVLQCTVWATDSEHAVKIANEHRLRLLASNEWDGKDEAR